MVRPKNVRFGQHVRMVRTSKGIGLREFAKRLDISPTYVSQIEQGKFNPPAEKRIVRMAQILDEDPDELLALAGRVAEDLLGIIRRQPRALASLLRTAKTLSTDEINLLSKQAEKIKRQRRPKRQLPQAR